MIFLQDIISTQEVSNVVHLVVKVQHETHVSTSNIFIKAIFLIAFVWIGLIKRLSGPLETFHGKDKKAKASHIKSNDLLRLKKLELAAANTFHSQLSLHYGVLLLIFSILVPLSAP